MSAFLSLSLPAFLYFGILFVVLGVGVLYIIRHSRQSVNRARFELWMRTGLMHKPVVSILLVILLSPACKFFTPDSIDVSQNIQEIADFLPFDTETPLPSPGAAALRTLAEDVPGVAALIDDVEAAERAALEAVLEVLKPQTGADWITEPVALGPISPFTVLSIDHPIVMGTSAEGALIPVVYSGHFSPPADDGGLGQAPIIGDLVSMFSDMFVSELPAFPNRTSSETSAVGDVTTTMSMELGKQEDGSTTFSMGLQTEGSKNGVSVKTDNTAKVTGQRCPDANGQVNFTITARTGSESGGSGQTQDLTAVVQATVNDDAEITASQIDIVQGTRQVKDKRQVYVESGMTVKNKGANFDVSDVSDITLIHVSQDVTPDDDLSEPGLTSALSMGLRSLVSARYAWQNGTCTAIKAISPGSVQQGSTTEIPVKVLSRIDGSDIAAKLLAELTGEESVDPTSLAKTPGTLTYTAPYEKGKSATILLTATSRRGKATLKLMANTGGQGYKVDEIISGDGVTFHYTGTSCDSPYGPWKIKSEGVLPGGTSFGNIDIPYSEDGKSSATLEEHVRTDMVAAGADVSGNTNVVITSTDSGYKINFATFEMPGSCWAPDVSTECIRGPYVGMVLNIIPAESGDCSQP